MADPARFPAEVAHSTERSDVRYRLSSEYFALKQHTPNPAGVVVQTVDDYRIFRLPGSGEFPGHALPVFQSIPGGSLAVATGRVFIRFAERGSAATRADDIERAGYTITEIPPYAPNTAWLEPASGSISDGLLFLEKLSSVPGVENVVPQFITQRTSRS